MWSFALIQTVPWGHIYSIWEKLVFVLNRQRYDCWCLDFLNFRCCFCFCCLRCGSSIGRRSFCVWCSYCSNCYCIDRFCSCFLFLSWSRWSQSCHVKQLFVFVKRYVSCRFLNISMETCSMYLDGPRLLLIGATGSGEKALHESMKWFLRSIPAFAEWR